MSQRQLWSGGARGFRKTALVVGAIGVIVAGIVVATVLIRGHSAAGEPTEANDDSVTSGYLAAWDKALGAIAGRPTIVTSDLSGQIGNWSKAEGDNNKQAELGGMMHAGADVQTASAPAPRDIRWADGTTQRMRVLSPAATLMTLTSSRSGSCDGCTPIVLEHPRLIDTTVQTPFGPATIPAWSYAVRGSAVRFTQVAVAAGDFPEVKGLPYGPTDPGMSESAHIDRSGALVLSFIAGPPASDGPCGVDYTGRVIESDRALAVVLEQVPAAEPADPDLVCPADAMTRTLRIVPPHPLGARVLIDGRSAMAIPRR